jgi:calcineurin-like phosphoesterase family protein
MSKNLWFISDTHFSHDNILNFRTHEDKHVREGFVDVQDMDETMIQRWNEVVKPGDKVYHLGDVCFRSVKRMHEIMPRLMGKKRLIPGNHDHYKQSDYEQHFEIHNCWRQFKQFDQPFVCTHVPVHVDTLYEGRFAAQGKQVFNVHGHIHEKTVLQPGKIKPDHRYICVCVEHIDYRPIHLDELFKIMKSYK